jgi:CRISPR system Cascade subunit CasC
MGGKTRLRISSQSLKRAWRTSDLFSEALKGHIGIRTKEMGVEIYNVLKSKDRRRNAKHGQRDCEVFGKAKKAMRQNPWKNGDEQLAHFTRKRKQTLWHLLRTGGKQTAPSDAISNCYRKTIPR